MRAPILLALLMASPVIARDQTAAARPDFSGHWRIEETLSQLNGAGGWFGNDCDITQTTKDITFAAGGNGPGTGRSTYATNGTETKRQTAFGTRVEKAIWSGSRLIMTTTFVATPVDTTPARVQTQSTTTRTTTVFLDSTGMLVVDVAESPPSTGHFAVHSVYKKQQAVRAPSDL